MVEIVQGSDEWKALRLGRVTASRVADATDLLKSGKPGAKRDAYMGELISERLTGLADEKFVNARMAWGNEQEPQARSLYEFLNGVTVEQVAFVEHPSILMAGASPDGLIGEDGLIEIKCPGTYTHIQTLLAQEIPEQHVKQIMWQMACTGRRWCDFVSYDPRLPPHLSLFQKRFDRDDVAVAALETEIRTFLAEIDATVDALNALYAQSEAA